MARVDVELEHAFYVGEQACRGRLEPRGFFATFGQSLDELFGSELQFLKDRGLMEVAGERWRKRTGVGFDLGHLLGFLLDREGTEGRGAATSGFAPPSLTLSQYGAVREELPPSLLWCRIAMRAHQACRRSQGELPLPPESLSRGAATGG